MRGARQARHTARRAPAPRADRALASSDSLPDRGAMAPLERLELPELVQIEPIHTCNLRCVMCHVSYEKLSHRRLDVPLLLERLRGLEGRWIDLGGMYEPAAHP